MSDKQIATIPNPIKLKLFFIAKLPFAFLAGLKIKEFSEAHSNVQIRYSYFTKNPFRSIYFACLAMAAELASGSLAVFHSAQITPKISMLVVSMQANFIKKAAGKISFICTDGKLIEETINKAIVTNEGQSAMCKSIGIDETGETVAEFLITWSFKQKKN